MNEHPKRQVCIRLPEQVGKQELLRGMADALQFPDWFGENWDALWDALDEYLALGERPLQLVLDCTRSHTVDRADWDVFVSILEQARQSWPEFSWYCEGWPDGEAVRP